MEQDDYQKVIEEQGFDIQYNLPGDGSCQFAALANQLSALGIFRSAESMCEETVRYLQTTTVDNKGFSLFGVSSGIYFLGAIFGIHGQI